MSLPCLAGRVVVKTLKMFGWAESPGRPGKGDHIILEKPNHRATLSVPNHKEVKRGTLRALLRNAGISEEEFTNAAKGKRKKKP